MIKLNGKEIVIGTFPNGEKNYAITAINEYEPNVVDYKFTDNGSLIDLFFLMQEIWHKKGEYNETILNILYMPYSRMDRANDDYMFTLKYMGRLFNNIGNVSINVIEPHSQATIDILNAQPNLRKEVKAVYRSLDLLRERTNLMDFDNTVLVMPDNGAKLRYLSLDDDRVNFMNKVTFEKKRDFDTGQITSIDFCEEDMGVDLFDKTAVIIDDLCSRGGTFMGTAAKLREAGADEIILIVTHCEEAIFDGAILTTDLIDEVITTNSIINDNRGHKKLKIRD